MINISFFTCEPPVLDKRYKVEGFRYNCCYRNSEEAIAALAENTDKKVIIYSVGERDRETEIYRGANDDKAVEALKVIEEW